MISKILIAGAGQLGSRYLQGLAKCRLPLRIYVQDICGESLARAEQRWNEVIGKCNLHKVTYHASLISIDNKLDIAIVATNADVRPKVVREIVNLSKVRYWVLEKVLAQSELSINEITWNTKNSFGAWVNTPRRMMPWHQQIKSKLDLQQPLALRVEGGLWGMACNAVHFLDLFTWWTGETLQAVKTNQLSSDFFKSKRQGSWEVLGAMEAQFSGGSKVILTAEDVESPLILKVSNGELRWLIKESEGIVESTDGMMIPGRIINQSEMTSTLVEDILERGNCELPTLEDSATLHRVFISSMLEHWRHVVNPAATIVPIT